MSKEFYFVDGLQNLLQKSLKEVLLLWYIVLIQRSNIYKVEAAEATFSRPQQKYNNKYYLVLLYRPDSSVGRVLGSSKLEVVGSIPATSRIFFSLFFPQECNFFLSQSYCSSRAIKSDFRMKLQKLQNVYKFQSIILILPDYYIVLNNFSEVVEAA